MPPNDDRTDSISLSYTTALLTEEVAKLFSVVKDIDARIRDESDGERWVVSTNYETPIAGLELKLSDGTLEVYDFEW